MKPLDKIAILLCFVFFCIPASIAGNPGKPDAGRDFLTARQGKVLLRLARKSLQKKLTPGEVEPLSQSMQKSLTNSSLQQNRGTFVTLYKNNRLRGCMGNILTQNSIVKSIQLNAFRAAFKDPRFPPLTAWELKKVRIELSILSRPRPLSYKNPSGLLEKLRNTQPGVILKKDNSSATYLPQVWEELPRTQNFLNRLCKKAGLSKHAWRKEQIQIFTYRAQHFEEKP